MITLTRVLHRIRPAAEDFFESLLVDLPVDDPPSPTPTPTPSRSSTLTTGFSTPADCPSPIQTDPSTATFPSTNSAETNQSFRNRFRTAFAAEQAFSNFELLCSQFSSDAVTLAREITSNRRPASAPHHSDRPSARPPIDNRRPTTADPHAARRLQTLYRLSKNRAARKIFGDESPGFDGTIDEAADFFRNAFGQQDCNLIHLQEELNSHIPSLETDNSLFTPDPRRTLPEVTIFL